MSSNVTMNWLQAATSQVDFNVRTIFISGKRRIIYEYMYVYVYLLTKENNSFKVTSIFDKFDVSPIFVITCKRINDLCDKRG